MGRTSTEQARRAPETTAQGKQRDQMTGPRRATPLGRPRKQAKDKAKAVTLTLWRDEFDGLDQMLGRIQRASPGHISRSDLVRVALALLDRLTDDEVIRLLIVLRHARCDP